MTCGERRCSWGDGSGLEVRSTLGKGYVSVKEQVGLDKSTMSVLSAETSFFKFELKKVERSLSLQYKSYSNRARLRRNIFKFISTSRGTYCTTKCSSYSTVLYTVPR